MSRLRAAALALLLVAALAGCLGSGGGDRNGGTGDPTSTGPTPTGSGTPTLPPVPPQQLAVDLLLDFAFAPCRGITVQSPQPREQVQALLPEGFTAAPAAGGDQAAVVGIDLYVCGNLTTPSARIGAVAFGQVYAHVERPEERLPGAPEADVHEYAFRMLAGDDILARLWPAAGYETRNGTANVSVDHAVAGSPVDLGLRLGGGSVGDLYTMLGSGSPPTPAAAPVPARFARYTALEDGSVLVWTGTYVPSVWTEGQGTANVPDDDPLAGFERGNNLAGLARLFESVDVVDQDLRRYF